MPIESELALRNRDWVEANLRKVDAATGGRVAYVYVPNTATLGYTYFKRYFYPQAYKDAVILDERYNGGGSVADYYIDVLQKKLIAYWAMRYGADMKTPSALDPGPEGHDRRRERGLRRRPAAVDVPQVQGRTDRRQAHVGRPRRHPRLPGADGRRRDHRAEPRDLGRGEGLVVENEGVPPDIEVEQTPADVIAGRDPQLERAIAIVMEELKKNPPRAAAAGLSGQDLTDTAR